MRNGGITKAIVSCLWKPVDIAGLVFFRVIFGALCFADLCGSWVYYHFMVGAYDPNRFQFKYYGFEWVQVWAEPWMSLFFVGGLLLSVAVSIGWRYRVTAPLLAIFMSYYFLLEKAHYLNHGYLMCWIAWVMAFLPAWRALSWDVVRQPTAAVQNIPRWCHALLPFLMGIVYFFGGIAKINPYWLLEAMPLQLWLKTKSNLFLIGPLLTYDSTAWLMSWGGAIFDLSIVFLLLHPKSRLFGFCWAIAFHLINHLIFNIGVFPYLSLTLTSMFFSPSWPRRWLLHITSKWSRLARWLKKYWWKKEVTLVVWQSSERYRRPVMIVLVIIVALHVALPLRHWCFPTDVAWSEEGHRYAWRMMLRSKKGHGYFMVNKPGVEVAERIRLRGVLSPKQYRKLWTHPDMILQYAHHLRDEALSQGDTIAVYAHVRVKLNNGKYHQYIDEEVDLSDQEWSFVATKTWVLEENE